MYKGGRIAKRAIFYRQTLSIERDIDKAVKKSADNCYAN